MAIALSIVLVVVECRRAGVPGAAATITSRYPWLVSFGFGLLHGFGFAGALSEIGLPAGRAPLALLCFNVGVELGQLAVVGLLFALHQLLRGARVPSVRVDLGRALASYAIGTLAVYWTIDRVVARWL